MSKLTEQLAVLMQADSVPMSDAWGKLYDELKRIDEARAKPIGEVVAWGENIPERQGIDRKVDFRWLDYDVQPGTQLYAHPPARTEQDSKPKTVPVAVAWSTDDRETDQSATTYDMELAGRWLEKGWKVTPLFEFVQEPPKKQGLRAGINKIREHFGFNLHSHQREAMRHFPIPPHLLDTTFHIDPKVMHKAQKGIDTSTDLFDAARRQYMDALDQEVREAIQDRKPATEAEARAIYDEVNRRHTMMLNPARPGRPPAIPRYHRAKPISYAHNPFEHIVTSEDLEESERVGLEKSTPLLTIGVSLTPEYATLAYQVNDGWIIKRLEIHEDAESAVKEIQEELATIPYMANLVISNSGIGHYVAHRLVNEGQPVKLIHMGKSPSVLYESNRFVNMRAKGYRLMMDEAEKLNPFPHMMIADTGLNLNGIISANTDGKLVAKNQNTLQAELPDHYMMLEAMALYYLSSDAVQVDL